MEIKTIRVKIIKRYLFIIILLPLFYSVKRIAIN